MPWPAIVYYGTIYPSIKTSPINKLVGLAILLFLACSMLANAQTYTAPKGHPPQSFLLPDNSRLWLQPGSTATFVATHPSASLQLSGSGFLKINRNKSSDHYLTVISQGAASFTLTVNTDVFLTNFSEDREAKISTTEGILQVRAKGAIFRVVNTAALVITDTVRYMQADPWTNDTAFINERIVQASKPLFQIINELGRYYDLTVIYQVPVDDKFHGSLVLHGERLTSVVKFICACNDDLSYTLEGKTLTLFKKPSINP